MYFETLSYPFNHVIYVVYTSYTHIKSKKGKKGVYDILLFKSISYTP